MGKEDPLAVGQKVGVASLRSLPRRFPEALVPLHQA